MKLLAYKINGKIINVECFNWNLSELNGNKPWVVSDVDLFNYTDITSIENWDSLSPNIDKDYSFIRQRIKEILDVSYVDKDGNTITYTDYMNYNEGIIASKYFLVDKLKRDYYLSESEQIFWWTNLVERSQQSRKTRWEKTKTYISYSLSPIDSSDLALSTTDLCNNYINYNITSKSKDGASGLFDYLRGTEDFISNGYPSKSYWSQQDQNRLLDILENGNY